MLFEKYHSPEGYFDEAFSAPGVPRPHWASLVAGLNAIAPTAISERWERGRRILRDHAVTYNVSDSTDDPERAWELDLIPFMLSAQEWAKIEQGVIQRANLLNFILQDLYIGKHRLLGNGLIPPAIVYSNPSFLRPCRGIKVPKGQYLHLHAVDLARGPDGRWLVLDDRTQSPSGMGYALENRTIIARLLQDDFRKAQVLRLNEFFNHFRTTLAELAPSGSSWPRIVVLTPGSLNEAYYEHSLLARFLGFTLVEGGDLTVRDRKVFLKTFEGLQRVDVIMRRLNDDFADPLELREESVLGVPGLVEAARAGNVAIANALGSSIVETPALLPLLPELSRHVLGEELILPSADMWWCGDPAGQDYVLSNLNELIIKSAISTRRFKTFSAPELTEKERAQLKSNIQAHPHQYIGQQRVPLSHAPVWSNGKFKPRPLVLRVYVAASQDGYVVMPGGLTKVSSSMSNQVTGFQMGGGSKDTWVLSEGPTEARTHAPIKLETRPARRIATGVPSRTIENLFWLGRYSERLEHTARILRCAIAKLNDEPGSHSSVEIASLYPIVTSLGPLLPEGTVAPQGNNADLYTSALELMYNRQIAGSIGDLVDRIRGIAWSAHDRFSADTWRILNRLRSYPGEKPSELELTTTQTKIHRLIADLAALSGMELENMTRGYEWRFLDFGRRLERAMSLCSLLQSVATNSAGPQPLLNPLLEICDSSMTYRRRYFSEPEFAFVLEVLLLDDTNPRALAFLINRMIARFSEFPEELKNVAPVQERKQLLQLGKKLDSNLMLRIDSLVREQMTQDASDIFDGMMQVMNDLSDTITQRYFSHTVVEVTG